MFAPSPGKHVIESETERKDTRPLSRARPGPHSLSLTRIETTGGKSFPPLSHLVPRLFEIPRALAYEDAPLIVPGSTLHITDVQLLPLMKGFEPKMDKDTGIAFHKAVAGYSVLQRIIGTEPKDYFRLLWTPSKEVALLLGSVHFMDSLDDLLRVFDLTRWGAAIVDSRGKHTLITLKEIVQLFRQNRITTKMEVKAVGSPLLTISPDASLLTAIKLLFRRRVRRLFIAGQDGRFVSDRSLVEFLFTPDRLSLVRSKPRSWLDANVSDLRPSKAKRISDKELVDKAASRIGDATDDCLVSDRGKVISRWDVVVKPWKAGKLELVS